MNLLSLGFPKLHAIELIIRSKLFHFYLRLIARFLRKHNLYPVNLNSNLLDVWEGKHLQR